MGKQVRISDLTINYEIVHRKIKYPRLEFKLDLIRTDNELKQLISSIIEDISSDLEINIHNIYFRRMKSKWGSCSPNKNLTINTLLKYLPYNLIEYVVFHEMIHLIERKHNEHFWKIIANKFDNYKEKEKELFEYWFLIQKVYIC
jgi:predicted metal-dependent hydrolase